MAPNGRDTHPGTAARPLRTIMNGVGRLRAGDTLLVRTGVYREAVTIWNKKGTRNAVIRVAAHPGETPVIEGRGSKATTALVAIGNSEWLRFEGFEVRNSPGDGIAMRRVRQIVVRGNVVHRSRNGGIRAWGGNSDLVIDRNSVHHNVTANSARDARQWSQAVGIMDSDRVAITANWVFKNWGEGIDYILSDRGTIAGNRVSDNFGANIYLDNARYTTVDANLIWSTADRNFFRHNAPASAIALANERYARQNPLTHLTITNNIAVRGRCGVYYGDSEFRGGLHHTRIANNTFYSFSWATFVLGAESGRRDAGHTTTVVENNIVYQRGGAYTARGSTGIAYRNNNWFGGNAATRVRSSGDVMADPQLARPGGTNADDYRLGPRSPCRDAGRTHTTINRDFFGTPRPRGRASDIGAHEG